MKSIPWIRLVPEGTIKSDLKGKGKYLRWKAYARLLIMIVLDIQEKFKDGRNQILNFFEDMFEGFSLNESPGKIAPKNSNLKAGPKPSKEKPATKSGNRSRTMTPPKQKKKPKSDDSGGSSSSSSTQDEFLQDTLVELQEIFKNLKNQAEEFKKERLEWFQKKVKLQKLMSTILNLKQQEETEARIEQAMQSLIDMLTQVPSTIYLLQQ